METWPRCFFGNLSRTFARLGSIGRNQCRGISTCMALVTSAIGLRRICFLQLELFIALRCEGTSPNDCLTTFLKRLSQSFVPAFFIIAAILAILDDKASIFKAWIRSVKSPKLEIFEKGCQRVNLCDVFFLQVLSGQDLLASYVPSFRRRRPSTHLCASSWELACIVSAGKHCRKQSIVSGVSRAATLRWWGGCGGVGVTYILGHQGLS